MRDRRKFPRAPLAVLLEICSGESKKGIGKGFITNLSEGGLALEATTRLRLGDKFMLRFTLPNGWNFNILGEIVYIKEGVLTRAYGVKFKKINPELRLKVKRYVLANLDVK